MPHPEYLALGATKASRITSYRKLFDCELKEGTIEAIRYAANTGLVLSNDNFRKQVEQLTGQRQHHLKRGLKPRSNTDPKKEFLL